MNFFFFRKGSQKKKKDAAALPVPRSVIAGGENCVDESQRVQSRSSSRQRSMSARHGTSTQLAQSSYTSQRDNISPIVRSFIDTPAKMGPHSRFSPTAAPPSPGAVKLMKKVPMLPPGVKLMKGPPPLLPDTVKASYWRGVGGGGSPAAGGGGGGGRGGRGRGAMGPRGPVVGPSPSPQPPAAQRKIGPAPISPAPLSLGKSKLVSPPLVRTCRITRSPSPNRPPGGVSFSANSISAKQKMNNNASSELPCPKVAQETLPSVKADAGKVEEFPQSINKKVVDKSESDTEFQFVLENGSHEATSPSLTMNSKERQDSVPLNPSFTQRHKETSVESVEFSYENDNVADVMQKGGNSPQCSQKSSGSLTSPGKSPSNEEKKSENLNGINKLSSLLDAAKNNVLCDSKSLAEEKKQLTPVKEKLLEEILDSSLSCDCSPELLERTLQQKRPHNKSAVSNNVESTLERKKNELTMPEEKLSGSVKDRIIEQFFSILSPQQFYGKVTKLHRIRLMKSDSESAPGIKEFKTIFLATKGTLPNHFFYPQLRFTESDMPVTGTSGLPEHIDTPIILYEAAPGNMLFAETENEARHVLESNSSVTSCFVLDKSAIIFKDPLKYALPIAMLTVQWIPYSVALSEPRCFLHQKELQLFDSSTKELRCALCVSKNGLSISDFVVIPEVLSGDSRRHVLEELSHQIQQKKKSAAEWLGKHQRIVSVTQRKKDAINQQFDLLLAAIKSKREEFLEQCDIAFGFALSSAAKEILTIDENVCLLKAAIGHLRAESTNPLYSMQIATVANALHSIKEDSGSSLSFDSLEIPLLFNELTPNLETVMGEVQKLSPIAVRTKTHYAICPTEGTTTVLRSPKERQRHKIQEEYDRRNSHMAVENLRYLDLEQGSHTSKKPLLCHPSNRKSHTCGRGISYSNSTSNNNEKKKISLRRSASLTPRHYDKQDFMSNSAKNLSKNYREGQWVTIPGSCGGTCVLDTPIHELLADGGEAKNISPIHKCLQWVLRVEDPGEWVGIGVGVGGNIAAWSASRTPDFSHLWVVPRGDNKRTFILRVSVSPTLGYARLTIHDGRGKRLDDGRIPQWNATRSCYPQVTFSENLGHVYLTESPRIVPK